MLPDLFVFDRARVKHVIEINAIGERHDTGDYPLGGDDPLRKFVAVDTGAGVLDHIANSVQPPPGRFNTGIRYPAMTAESLQGFLDKIAVGESSKKVLGRGEYGALNGSVKENHRRLTVHRSGRSGLTGCEISK